MGKTTSKVTYDDRRKELTHQVDSEQEAKNNDGEIVGNITTRMTGVYKEAGIRKIVGEMQDDIATLEKEIKTAERGLDELKDVEETEEVKKYIELQKKIAKIKQKEQIETQLKEHEEKVKTTKKNLSQIKDTIGTRLKF